MDTDEIQSLILTMVRAIVKRPDDVTLHIKEVSDEKGEYTQINIKVATEDIPTCIGSGGATAEAIRRITILAGKKQELPRPLFVRVDAPRMPKNHFNFEPIGT